MSSHRQHEGLKAARLLMVLSGFSPLFILWAIKGNSLIPDPYFVGFCAAMVVLPYAVLGLRIRTAKNLRETSEIVVGAAEDHRSHLLVYLFAMLLPIYEADSDSYRELAAVVVALGFIVFLFWHLNLHYMNLIFAVLGYRVFAVSPPQDENLLTGRTSQVVITRRPVLLPREKFIAYRISDTVYLEVNKQ